MSLAHFQCPNLGVGGGGVVKMIRLCFSMLNESCLSICSLVVMFCLYIVVNRHIYIYVCVSPKK